MNKYRGWALLLAIAMVLAAFPVAGLAASNDPKDESGVTDPLHIKVTTGDTTVPVYYMPFESKKEERDKLPMDYEIYMPYGKMENKRIKLSYTKDAEQTVDLRVTGQSVVKESSSILDTQVEYTLYIGDYFSKDDLAEIEIKGASTNGPKEGKYKIRMYYSTLVTTTLGEHGTVQLAQGTYADSDIVVNEGKKVKDLPKKTTIRYLFDKTETLIYSVTPDKGYIPKVTGAVPYDETIYEHRGLLFVNAPEGKENIAKSDTRMKDAYWFIITNLGERDYNVDIAYIPEVDGITKIEATPAEFKYDDKGGDSTIKVTASYLDNHDMHLGIFEEGKDKPTGELIELKKEREKKLKFEPYEEIGDKKYIIKASVDGGTTWSEANAEVIVKGKEAESKRITSVEAAAKTLTHEGGYIDVTIGGDEIKDDEKVLVAAFLKGEENDSFSVTRNGKGKVAVHFKPNTTDKDQVYTVKASLDEAKAWSDKTAEITVQAKKEEPEITEIKTNIEKLTNAGGAITASVKGNSLDGKSIKIVAFDGSAQVATKTIVGAGEAELSIPANAAPTDKEYMIKASLDDGATWSDKTAKVTVQGKPDLPKNGWEKKDGKWYYMRNNAYVKNEWVKDAGHWYFLKADGTMKIGWLWDGGKWYFLKADGTMKVGWLWDSGNWYFLKGDGAMKDGWLSDGGKWYFLMRGDGRMLTGWQKDGKWYYLNRPNGDMRVGQWLQDGRHWYFLTAPNGDMAIGTHNVNGRVYRFNLNGEWIN